jgi:UDP-2,3-diacylglucosamine pyrophosphatase LpxH
MSHYYEQGYIYIDLGDGDDIWKNKNYADIKTIYADIFELTDKFYADKRMYIICGNHDNVKTNKKWRAANSYNKDVHDGFILNYAGRQIFLLHGHQADTFDFNVKIMCAIRK